MTLPQPTIPRAASPQYERVAQWRCIYWHFRYGKWIVERTTVEADDSDGARTVAANLMGWPNDDFRVSYISHVTRKVQA